MSIFIEGTPNPFELLKPPDYWLKPIQDYDADLRLYPSQTKPVYRLARVAHRSGGILRRTVGKLADNLPGTHPDTKVAFDYGLQPVTTIPKDAVTAPPQNIVQQLMARDQWLHGKGTDDDAAARVSKLLDDRDAAHVESLHQQNRDELYRRSEAARISLLYRIGARVSLVKPPALTRRSSPSSGSSAAGTTPTAGGTIA